MATTINPAAALQRWQTTFPQASRGRQSALSRQLPTADLPDASTRPNLPTHLAVPILDTSLAQNNATTSSIPSGALTTITNFEEYPAEIRIQILSLCLDESLQTVFNLVNAFVTRPGHTGDPQMLEDVIGILHKGNTLQISGAHWPTFQSMPVEFWSTIEGVNFTCDDQSTTPPSLALVKPTPLSEEPASLFSTVGSVHIEAFGRGTDWLVFFLESGLSPFLACTEFSISFVVPAVSEESVWWFRYEDGEVQMHDLRKFLIRWVEGHIGAPPTMARWGEKEADRVEWIINDEVRKKVREFPKAKLGFNKVMTSFCFGQS